MVDRHVIQPGMTNQSATLTAFARLIGIEAEQPDESYDVNNIDADPGFVACHEGNHLGRSQTPIPEATGHRLLHVSASC